MPLNETHFLSYKPIIRKGLARNANVKELAGDMHGTQADLDLLKRLGVARM